MADMIGLLRFGMPINPVPPAPQVEAQGQRAVPAVAAVTPASGGGQTAGHYSATPRPTISPQFAYTSAGDGSGDAVPPKRTGGSAVIDPPKPFDPDVLTGPPPTFEATLMQVEAHLRLSLARIDATRHAHPMDRPQVEKPKVEPKGDTSPAAPIGTATAPPVPAAEPAPQPVKSDRPTSAETPVAATAPAGGKADTPHGKADMSHGKADMSHGKADTPHGKADMSHGKADTPRPAARSEPVPAQ